MKAIIFDFNGTMVFDSVYHDKAWKLFSKQIRGYEMSDDEINHSVHGKVNKAIIEYLKPGVSEEENLRLSLEKEACYRELCLLDKKNYKLVDGLEEYFDYLKDKKIPFTIASASIKENIDFFVDIFKLDKWIDPSLIVYNDDTHLDKKSMFLEAARRLQVNIEECYIFEDSFIGVKAASDIGAGGIIAIPSKHYVEEFKNFTFVDFIIESYHDNRLKELF